MYTSYNDCTHYERVKAYYFWEKQKEQYRRGYYKALNSGDNGIAYFCATRVIWALDNMPIHTTRLNRHIAYTARWINRASKVIGE